MRLLNIDFHIAVVTDIKEIFSRLGHQVDSLDLSVNHWVMGREPAGIPGLVGIRHGAFDQSECDRFWMLEQDRLAPYDAFLVTHTPSLIGLYERTGKPVICIVSTRFDLASHTLTSRTWLIVTMRRMWHTGQLMLLANNAYDQWHTERHTGLKPQLVPSLCDYTGVRWKGGGTSAFFDGNCPAPAGLRQLPAGHSWQDVADATACVGIPPNVSQMSLFERHSMGLPLLLPSKSWLDHHPQAFSELRSCSLSNSRFDHEQACKLADWLVGELPGVTTFDHIADIARVLADGIPATTGQNERRDRITALWRQILDGLAVRPKPNPWRGDTSGVWRWAENWHGRLYPNGAFDQTCDLWLWKKFGTWHQGGDTIHLELTGHWRKRVVMIDADFGIYFLNGEASPGGVFLRENPASRGLTREFHSCDSVARLPEVMHVHARDILEWQRKCRPGRPYTLVSAYSDETITEEYREVLDDPDLVVMHANNVGIKHPKLRAIGLGVSGSYSLDDAHHDRVPSVKPWLYDARLLEARNAKKTKEFNVSFRAHTNRHGERQHCLNCLKLPNVVMDPDAYLDDLAASRFCISPNGNGIDCLRTWEALMVRTVPVITRNPMAEQGMYDNLPVIILNRWEDFQQGYFTRELHQVMMEEFNPGMMTTEWWLGRRPPPLADFEEVAARKVAQLEENYWNRFLDYCYGTHIEALCDVLRVLRLRPNQQIVEVGGGFFSTPLLLATRAEVLTIEQGQNTSDEINQKWANQLQYAFNTRNNWTFAHHSAHNSWRNVAMPQAEIGFVDGEATQRQAIINHMLDRCFPVIVAHDSENPIFGYNPIGTPDGYVCYDFRKRHVWTRIWTCRSDVMEMLQSTSTYHKV